MHPSFQIKFRLHYKIAFGFIVLFLLLATITASVSIFILKKNVLAQKHTELYAKTNQMESILDEAYLRLQTELKQFLTQSGLEPALRDLCQQSPFYYPSKFRQHKLNQFRKADLFHYQYEFLRSMHYFAKKKNLSRFEFHLLPPHDLFENIGPQPFVQIARDHAILHQYEAIGSTAATTYAAPLERLRFIGSEAFLSYAKKMKFMGFDTHKAQALLRQSGFSQKAVAREDVLSIHTISKEVLSEKRLVKEGILYHIEYVLSDMIYNPKTDRDEPSRLGVLVIQFVVDHHVLKTVRDKIGGEFAFFQNNQLLFSSLGHPNNSAGLGADGMIHINGKAFLSVLSKKNILTDQHARVFPAALVNAEFIHTLIGHILRITIITMTLLFIGIIILTRIMVMWLVGKPIARLSDVVQHMISGDLSRRVSIRSKDEIGFLGYSFNHMVATMQQTFSKLESAHRIIEKNNCNLEKTISERTQELNRKNKMLNATIKKLKHAKDEAERANRAKSEFLANVSHEIRTPLNAVLGFSEILEKQITDEQQKEYIAYVTSGSKTLLRLINDILDLSVLEAGRLELHKQPVRIHDICNEIQHFFSIQIKKKRLGFNIQVDPALSLALLLDEVRLRQILFNLVGNAIKFTHAGSIKLCVQKQFHNRTKETLDLAFHIQDTGIGIARDQKQLIFEAFKQQEGQNHAQYGGTGLGLAFSKRLVEKMGGKISVESELGKGSVFSVMLKDVAVAPDPAPWEQPDRMPCLAMDAVAFKNATILIVDNLADNRTLLKNILQSKDLNVIEADNGKTALRLANVHQPDIILMDMKMPVMDGYEAVRRLKADSNLRHIPIIAVSASTLSGDDLRGTQCNGFIRKPIIRHQLFSELKRCLADKPPNREPEAPNPVRPKAAGTAMDAYENVQALAARMTRHPQSEKDLWALKEILENEMMARWQQIQKVFLIDEIEDFSAAIIKLGAKHHVELLTAWGSALGRQTRRFDMANLPKMLSTYTDLVEEIGKYCKTSVRP